MGKTYFASDFHLGAPDYESSLGREKMVVSWLNEIQSDCSELYLLGDVFDFWFEHKHTIPKYYTRLLGKLAEFTDNGIPVHFFIGNHDMWTFGYLKKELGLQVHHEPAILEIAGFKCFLAHGDGLGPGDRSYKFFKGVFRDRLARWLFARLHPNFSFYLAHSWSRSSRNTGEDPGFLGEENEWLVQFCNDKLKSEHFDLMIFGHRHLPLDLKLSKGGRYINLGDWIRHFTYLEIADGKASLRTYQDKA